MIGRILFVVLVAVQGVCFAADPPAPSFDRIDYNRPDDCLVLSESLGDAKNIREVAATLKAKSPEQTLVAIHRWLNTNLKCDPKLAYEYRDFDATRRAGAYGGCADYAVTYVALARACGVPTVFVKTMDVDWIYEFRHAGTCKSWRGHVYLEVFLNGKWALLEPGGNMLYTQYDPSQRLMPGGQRWAYDKGVDPKALVLSPDWERWKVQTAAHFKDFDLRQLPVTQDGDRLGTVYVTANSPVWEMINKRLNPLGIPVFSFNHDFERLLPKARGGRLIVTCVGDTLVLPEDKRESLLPMSFDRVQAELRRKSSGTASRVLEDGTRVTLLYARDVKAIEDLLKTWKPDDD